MMGDSWSCYTIGLGGVGADGPAVRAVGSVGDWNQARDADGLKIHAVHSWILLACLTLCRPVYVCFKCRGLGRVISGMGLPT